MSIYIISDAHGRADEFFNLLNIINFNEEDTLYVLGDVMEYEYEPLRIMDYIMANDNIILLKGNQEDIFINEINKIIEIDYFINDSNNDEKYDNTIDVIARRGHEYANKLLAYLKSLPFITKVNNYILVHGDLDISKLNENITIEEFINLQDEHQCIYGRHFITTDEYINNTTVVLGHTIVMTLDRSCESIIRKKGKILVDCGASINKKLACLRLDDMKEFYSPINISKYV